MNELMQHHGCSNIFTVPDGLKELMSDITREVLRWQPPRLLEFITNYLSALLITRENGIMAVKILDDLCDCRPTVSEHLLQIGLKHGEAHELSGFIKSEIESEEIVEGKEKVKEAQIIKKILQKFDLDEEMSAKVCQVIRNAYRDYWYRKKALQPSIIINPNEAWEKAAKHTLDLYKKTRPSMSELQRATEKIQAAYRGYHVRRNVLRHLQPEARKKKKPGRKVSIPGPPLDIARSREIDLGPVISLRKVKEDNVTNLFDTLKREKNKMVPKYYTNKTITLASDKEPNARHIAMTLPPTEQRQSLMGMPIVKAIVDPAGEVTAALPDEKIPEVLPDDTIDIQESIEHLRKLSSSKDPPELAREAEALEVPEISEMREGENVEEFMPPLAIPEDIQEDLTDEYETTGSSRFSEAEDDTSRGR